MLFCGQALLKDPMTHFFLSFPLSIRRKIIAEVWKIRSKARCDILRVNNFPETLATQPPFLAAYKAAPANLLVTQRPGFHLNTHTGGSAHLLTVQGNFSLLSLGCRYRYLDFLLVFSVDLKYTLFLKLFYFELEEIRQFKRRKGCKWQRCEDKTLMSF